MPCQDITVIHPNGRQVTALVLGDPSCGRTIVYHHGFPATSGEALIAKSAASELGVCVVAIDRPGLGGSSWYEGRVLADWPNDVALVMDHLGISKFWVLGVSGGTPTAVTLAASLPERVLGLTIVSGMAPVGMEGSLKGANFVNRQILGLGVRHPRAMRKVIRGIAYVWWKIPSVIALWFGVLLPKVDREIVVQPRIAGLLGRSMKDAFRNGVDGVVTEFDLLLSDWSNYLRALAVPVSIWHGESDTYVPHSMGRILHESVTGSHFRSVGASGHFMVIPLIREVLTEIISTSWSQGEAGSA